MFSGFFFSRVNPKFSFLSVAAAVAVLYDHGMQSIEFYGRLLM